MFVIGDTIKTNGLGKDEGKFVCCLIVQIVKSSCIISKTGKMYAIKSMSDLRSSRMVLVEKTSSWFKINYDALNIS